MKADNAVDVQRKKKVRVQRTFKQNSSDNKKNKSNIKSKRQKKSQYKRKAEHIIHHIQTFVPLWENIKVYMTICIQIVRRLITDFFLNTSNILLLFIFFIAVSRFCSF